jgi:hypothetical protein
MKHIWILRVIAGLVLVAGIIAVGVVAYQAGLAQGADGIASAVPAQAPIPFHHGAMFPGIFLLPLLLCAAPFFLCFFFFIPFRILIGGHLAHRMPFGRFHHFHGEEGTVPPPFEEWHRRAHEHKPE